MCVCICQHEWRAWVKTRSSTAVLERVAKVVRRVREWLLEVCLNLICRNDNIYIPHIHIALSGKHQVSRDFPVITTQASRFSAMLDTSGAGKKEACDKFWGLTPAGIEQFLKCEGDFPKTYNDTLAFCGGEHGGRHTPPTTQPTRRSVSRRPLPHRELVFRTATGTPAIGPTIAAATMCPKCGKFKSSGRVSCCAPNGAWFKNCGGPKNKKIGHKWSEGVTACKGEFNTCVVLSIHS